nr:plasmid partition protein ParG [Microseira wollei]
MSEEKQVKMSVYLPEDVRARFKAACAMRKVSMNQVITDFIQEWLEENETPSPAKKKEDK